MALYAQTRKSGTVFEDQVYNVIKDYTRSIWRNLRFETLLTVQGNTEVDILFCYKNLIFVVEAKNVSAIMGEYGAKYWQFIGSKGSSTEVTEYSALNVLTQNNLHVRSFKELYFAMYREWPTVVSLIVVPDACRVTSELAPIIHTLSGFDRLLAGAADWDVECKIQRKVAAMLTGAGRVVLRPDFYTDSDGVRHKKA